MRAPGATDQIKTVGQGFSTSGLTGEYLLSAVTFSIRSFDPEVIGLTFNVTITETSKASTHPNDSTGISFTSTQSGILKAGLQENDYMTLTLDLPVTLKEGKFYNVVFSFAEPTSGTTAVKRLVFNIINSGNPGSPNTTGGQRWLETDGVFAASSTNGLIFYAHAQAIPEPSALLLMGGGVLALAFLRKYSKAQRS